MSPPTTRYSYLWYTILLLSLTTTARAYTKTQFRDYWHSSSWDIAKVVEEECKANHTALLNDPDKGGFDLVSCLLDALPEFQKAEMAISAVLLGLLPSVLQLMGPKITDISMIALQRPFLALLTTIGSPSITFDHENTGTEYIWQRDTRPLWPTDRTSRHLGMKITISTLQYSSLAVVAWNAIYQAYALTYRTVVLISTMTGTFGHTEEAFAPLLWVFLAVPIQALSVAAMALCTEKIDNKSTGDLPTMHMETEVDGQSKRGVLGWIFQELTPCIFANVPKRRAAELEMSQRYILLLLNWAIRIFSWLHIIYGTVILASVLFLSLWDTIEVVARFLCGAIVCRLIVTFESHGLRDLRAVIEGRDVDEDREMVEKRGEYARVK